MSGWGESDARGEWYASRDFDFKNLRAREGDRLPDAWQRPQNVQYLKQTYGKDCVQYKSKAVMSSVPGKKRHYREEKKGK